jgi:PAS domain S-box-containing protein
LLILAALRFGLGGTSAAMLVITFQAILGTMHGRGPFLMQSPAENALALQMFLLFTAVPLTFLAVLIDEGRRSQSELRESELRFRNVANTVPVLIWMADTDMLCSFVNKGWLDFTGRTPEQELGTGWAEGIHREDVDRCLEVVTNSFAARQEFRIEYRLRKRDGAYGWVLDTGVPRFAPDGAFLGYIGSCVDITERREAEAELRASQERMTLAAEAAQLGLWTWDIPGNSLWLTDKLRELMGYSATEKVTYEGFLERVHEEDRTTVAQTVVQAFAHCGRFQTEYRVVQPDGTLRWLSGSGRVKADATGTPEQMLGVFMDITERHRVDEESRQLSGKLITAQEDERKRIARDLHDDLNQRLALLSVEMELFGADFKDTRGPARERLDSMTSHVRDLSSEVHRLSYQLHPAKLDQLGLVVAARTFCREVSTQSSLPVHFEQHDVPRDVAVDVALCLYRVIQEGVQNAVRHNGGSAIQVNLTSAAKQIRLLITDEGKGFDVDHAMLNGGLGLVSMRERVRQVHGFIQFTSSVGKGTRIEATVPLQHKASAI